MKKKDIAVFVVIFSLFANFAVCVYDSASPHFHCSAVNDAVHLCESIEDSEPVEYVKVETSKIHIGRISFLDAIIHEIKPVVPENYECIVVKPKNRVQEARRNVDEHNTNICSKSC